MLRVVVVNGLLIGLVLIVAELLFGTWFSEKHAMLKFTKVRNYENIQDNPIHVGKPSIKYTRDEYGFRGLDGDVSNIDILTVGGSTTDQRWVDDSETYQAVMRDLFVEEGIEVSIANAGIDGQSTFGHIANFTSWFNEIPDLKARYVLYYIGINDLLKSQPRAEFDVVAMEESTYNALKATIKDKSILYQLYRVAKGAFSEDPALNELNRDNIADHEPLTTEPLISAPLSDVFQVPLEGYAERITELDRLTREFGAEPIFVTQRSARWDRRDGEIVGIAEYKPDFFERIRLQLPEDYQTLNGVDFYLLERTLADAQMKVCEQLGAICINLLEEIDFDLEMDFYDPIHTTALGSRAIGEYLFVRLHDLGLEGL